MKIFKMEHLFFYFVGLATLLSCSNNQSTIKSPSSDSTIQLQALLNNNADTIPNKVDANDNDELKEIVQQYVDQYKMKYNMDTTFNIGTDSFQVVFKYECLFDSSIHVPDNYVSIYGLKNFITHDFASSIVIYKNRKILIEKEISKNSFSKLIDNDLMLNGALLYPNLHFDKDPLVRIHYSVSIPLTDIGKGVSVLVDSAGKLTVK